MTKAHHSHFDKSVTVGKYVYNVKNVLGQGFSSVVYRGEHQDLKKPVAIKVIDNQVLKEDIHHTLLRSELDILKTIKGCEHVLEYYETIFQKGRTYIVTEICQTDLEKQIQMSLTVEAIQNYIEQIFKGYQEIYQKGIIHRDIKPSNLFIDENNQIKIGDFGFAIKEQDKFKQIKFNIGSPLYMSPEALKNNQYSYKSDIWSLGITVFQLIFGDIPWNANNEQQLYVKLQEQKIQDLLLSKDLNKNLRNILCKALQFDIENRAEPEQIFEFSFQNDEQRNCKINSESTSTAIEIDTKNQGLNHSQRINKRSKTQKFKNSKLYECETLKPRLKIQKPISSRIHVAKKEDEQNVVKVENKKSDYTLSKSKCRKITNEILYYFHVCRLLYKILVRMRDAIHQNFNQNTITFFKQALEQISIHYCSFISDYLFKIKNYHKNNFINLSEEQYQSYIKNSQFQKVQQAATQYTQKYSKSQQLSSFWNKNLKTSIFESKNITQQIISKLWPQLCFKNKNQIILLEFFNFSFRIFENLQKNNLPKMNNKQMIYDFVDTIPNIPTLGRFKRSITQAKTICMIN